MNYEQVGRRQKSTLLVRRGIIGRRQNVVRREQEDRQKQVLHGH